MTQEVDFDSKRSAILRAVLLEGVTARAHKRLLHRRFSQEAVILVAAGLVTGSLLTGGSAWALAAHASVNNPLDKDNSSVSFPEYYDQLLPIGQMLAALSAKYPGVPASVWLDPKAVTLHVGYYISADKAQLTAYLREVSAIEPQAPLKIKASGVDFNYAQLKALNADIGTNPKKWSRYFGAEVTGSGLDAKTGEIHVHLANIPADAPRFTPDGTAVILDGAASIEFQ